MSSTKVWRPASRPRSMSARPTCSGGRNCGGCSAATMRPESCEPSSSTTAIAARDRLSGLARASA